MGKVVEGAKNLRKTKMGLDNSHYFEEADTKIEDIRKLLEDKTEKSKFEGMKRLIAVTISLSKSQLFR
jgi:hypothetical protein